MFLLLATPFPALNSDRDIGSKFYISLAWRRFTWWSVECYQPWKQLLLLLLPPCSQSQTPKHIRVLVPGQRRDWTRIVAPQAVIGIKSTRYVVIVLLEKSVASSWYYIHVFVIVHMQHRPNPERCTHKLSRWKAIYCWCTNVYGLGPSESSRKLFT